MRDRLPGTHPSSQVGKENQGPLGLTARQSALCCSGWEWGWGGCDPACRDEACSPRWWALLPQTSNGAAPQTSPRPACAALSPALCFYLSLMQPGTSANIDHGELGKILPAGFWQVITEAGNVCAHLGFSNPSNLWDRLRRASWISLVCLKSSTEERHVLKKTHPDEEAHSATQKWGDETQNLEETHWALQVFWAHKYIF